MRKQAKILIVDDDLLLLRMYHRLLTIEGYSVSMYNTAFGIFSTIAEYTPDLIIMDYQMPVVSGVEAIKQLKSHNDFQSIPVILYSSINNLEAVATEAGADAFVSKMAPSKELVTTVEEMITQSQMSKRAL